MPHEVEVTLSIWDDQKIKDSTVVFKIPIIPDLESELAEKAQKEPQQKQPAQTKQNQQAQNGEYDFSGLQGLINQFFGINNSNTGAT